jgi:hypothetical protein
MLLKPAIIVIVGLGRYLISFLCSNFGLKASCQSKAPQALGAVNGVAGGLAWQGASGSWWDDKC